MNRNFTRASQRRISKGIHNDLCVSHKHKVKLADREGMPLETSADCLTDPELRTTNTFRKECFRSRENVFHSTATKKKGKQARKISEMSFAQLDRAFRRSYDKRFKHLPNMLKRVKGDDARAAQMRQLIHMAMASHDKNIILVNSEIAKRHSKHITAAGRMMTEARLW